jgi:choline dehydrogenase
MRSRYCFLLSSTPCKYAGQRSPFPASALAGVCAGGRLRNVTRNLRLGLRTLRASAETEHSQGTRQAQYDFIIVGAGAAGCVLANRLSTAQFSNGDRRYPRVLLLEAGDALAEAPYFEHIPLGFPQLIGSRLDYGFFSRENPTHLGGRGAVYLPRGRGEGGSHAISVMLVHRGSRHDYETWVKDYEALGWGPDDVLPYFKRLESNERTAQRGADGEAATAVHGSDGPLRVSDQRSPNPLSLAFIEACLERGIRRNKDFNDWDHGQEGAGLFQVTQRDGRRESPATAYLQPVRSRRNLHIETNALAEHLVWSKDGRRVEGIRFIDRHGRRRAALAHCEVILAAGAINTPQLLMLSGLGPGAHLQDFGIPVVRDLPGVGQNLQDHAAVMLSYYAPDPYGKDRDKKRIFYTERLGKDPLVLAEYFLLGRGPLTSPVCEAGAFVHTQAVIGEPSCDLQLRFVPFFSDADPYKSLGEYRSGGHVLTNTSIRPAGFGLQAVAIRPRSRGRIELATIDPRARPIIHTGWLEDERDLQTLLSGLKLGREILSGDSMRPYRGREAFPETLEDDLVTYIRRTCHTANAIVGTARMGTGRDAVVDPELRVHGVERLRVIDASVMPKIIGGQTGVPTMMIAERGADLVKKTWKLV